MKKCPDCGGEMVLESGQINEPCVTRFMKIVRKTRPGKFWSCYACGYCEEAT